MLTQPKSKTFDLGDGREVTISTGRLARQADGAVTVQMGNSVLLATVVANKEGEVRFCWSYSGLILQARRSPE